MRPEPSAPEFSELQVAETPVYSYRSAPPSVTSTTTAMVPTDKILVGAWDAGFCSCLNFLVPNCCMAWCCPWVSLAQIVTRLGLYSYAKTVLLVLALHLGVWTGAVLSVAHRDRHDHEASGFGSGAESTVEDRVHFPRIRHSGYLSAWLLVSVVCGAVYVVAVWQLRTRVRDRFQISGTRARDLLAACCCSCCVVAQIATHVKSYTPGSCHLGPPVDTLPAYP